MVRLCIVQYKQASSNIHEPINTHLPHVKVAGNSQAVAVSGKVIPPVHINPKHLVGHNLTGKSNYEQGFNIANCIRKDCTHLKQEFLLNSPLLQIAKIVQ